MKSTGSWRREKLECREDKDFDGHRFYEGKPIDDWPQGITFYVEGEGEEDILIGGLGWNIVSDRVRQALDECHVTGVQLLPVRVVNKQKGEELDPYWAMNVFQEIEALDWEQTRWLYPEKVESDPYPELNIIKEVLREDPLRGIDILRLSVKG